MPRKLVGPVAALIVALGALLFLDGQCNGEKIKICSWNLQNFGDRLLPEKDIMKGIAEMVKDCHLVLFQEMFISDPIVFLNNIRKQGTLQWKSLQSDQPVALTNQQERQIILFREPVEPQNIGYLEHIPGQLDIDPNDEAPFFRRPPWKVKLAVKNLQGTILLIAHHAKPGCAFSEIYHTLTNLIKLQEGILIAGDLNADSPYVSAKQMDWLKNQFITFSWTSCGNIYTTPSKKCYDRFISNLAGIDVKTFQVKNFPSALVKPRANGNGHVPISDHYLISVIWETTSNNNSPGPSSSHKRKQSPGNNAAGKSQRAQGSSNANIHGTR